VEIISIFVYSNFTVMELSAEAIAKLKGNFKALGALCMEFDRHMKTVEGWIAEKNNRKIISPAAVKIIAKHTGIDQADVLDKL